MKKYGDYLISASIALLIFMVWGTAVEVYAIPPFVLPSPADVLRAGVEFAPQIWTNAKATFLELGIGFSCGVLLGTAFAFVIASSPVLKRALYPFLIAQQTVPTIVMAPLLIIWFGFGLMPQVIIITLVCFFPIAVNTSRGLLSTDRTLLNLVRSYGASKRQVLTKARIPSALPHFFTGLRLAATLSVIGAIVGEWMGTDVGLGRQLMMATMGLETDLAFAVIAVLMATGITLFSLTVLVERLVAPWSIEVHKDQ